MEYFDVFDTQFKLTLKPPQIDICDNCHSIQVRLKDNEKQEKQRQVHLLK